MARPLVRRVTLAVAAAAALAVVPTRGADAQVVFAPGPSGAADELVLLAGPGLVSTGNPVQGRTDRTGFVLDFAFPFPVAATLSTLEPGEPRVSMPGLAFNSLRFRFADPLVSFTALDFTITADQVGAVRFTALTTDGDVFTGDASLDAPAFNPFGVAAVGGRRLREVQYVSPAPFTVDVRRVRVGGAAVTTAVVPEPGAFALLGLGLLSLAGAARGGRAAAGAKR